MPNLFAQLYTIRACDGNLTNPIPILYILLPNKTTQTYQRMFAIIYSKIPSFTSKDWPEYFISDFEAGIIAAVKTALPNTRHLGCYFHYKSALLKYIANNGLKPLFGYPEFATQMRKVAALAFVPSKEAVLRGWLHLIETSSKEIRPFLEYFEEKWLGMLKLNKRRSPAPFNLWNFGEQIREGIPLFDNSVEIWNIKLNGFLEKHNQSLHTLLNAIDQALPGKLTKLNKSANVRTFTQRVTSLVESFTEETSIEAYLASVASLMFNSKK